MKLFASVLVIAAIAILGVAATRSTQRHVVTRAENGDFQVTFYGEDSWIDQAARDVNHIEDELLEVRYNRSRAILHFEELKHALNQVNVQNGGTGAPQIVSAKLRLRVSNVTNDTVDGEVAAHRIVNFDPSSATWDCASHDDETGCEQWRQIGLPPTVATSYNSEPIDTQTVVARATYGVVNFDVSAEVQNTLATSLQISFLVKKVDETSVGSIHFWSSESGAKEPDFSVGDVTLPERPVMPDVYLGPELIVVMQPNVVVARKVDEIIEINA